MEANETPVCSKCGQPAMLEDSITVTSGGSITVTLFEYSCEDHEGELLKKFQKRILGMIQRRRIDGST